MPLVAAVSSGVIPMHAVGAVIAVTFLAALGLLSLLYGDRDRIRVTFALFAFCWAGVAGASLWVQLSPDTATAAARGHLVPPPVALAVACLQLHLVALTGHDRRLDERLRLLPLTVRGFIVLVFVLAVTWGVVAATTNLVVVGARHDPLFGYLLTFRWVAVLMPLPLALLAVAGGLPMILGAIAEASPGPRRSFLIQSLVGFVVLQASAGLFIALLPTLGFPTMVVAFDVFTAVALYFYVIIARYQYRQIQDLNASLEHKVEERTRGLMLAQARLLQSQKLSSLGSLVAGVAHEVNTPLGAVRSMEDTRRRATEKLEARLGELASEGDRVHDDRAIARALEALKGGETVTRDGLDRIDGIITRLRSFAKLDQAELQSMRLSEGLADARGLLQVRLESVRIQEDFVDDPPILCQARHVNQVLFGLLTNALDAMAPGGTLTLILRAESSGVRLEVVDDGCGMAPAVLRQAFEPGFTTKGVGVGIGLGLTIAFQTISDHGGTIELDSREGEGTTARVWLPVEPPPDAVARR